jgi:hypothetical protein
MVGALFQSSLGMTMDLALLAFMATGSLLQSR